MRLTVPEEVVVAKVVIAACNVERNQPRVLVKPARNANNAAKAVAKPFDVVMSHCLMHRHRSVHSSSGSVLTTPLKFVFVIALPSMLELRDEATLIVLVELATPILLAVISLANLALASKHFNFFNIFPKKSFVYLHIEKNGTSTGAALTQPLTEYGYDFVLE
uniref:Uncharacterized protein n=1 Tax=Glossina palpalis gambiensis TaxID=67801 RepID=A0A1B0BNB3_9MUSC